MNSHKSQRQADDRRGDYDVEHRSSRVAGALSCAASVAKPGLSQNDNPPEIVSLDTWLAAHGASI